MRAIRRTWATVVSTIILTTGVSANDYDDPADLANRAHALIECSVFAENASVPDVDALQQAGFDLLVQLHSIRPADPSVPVPAIYSEPQRQAFSAGRMYDWWVKNTDREIDARQSIKYTFEVATDMNAHASWKEERERISELAYREKNCSLLVR